MFFSKQTKEVDWNHMTSDTKLEELDEHSYQQPVLIFKHSTRCGISAMSLNRFERNYKDAAFKPYFLDLIANRGLSNAVAAKYSIIHESPQAILVKDGKAVFNSSHNGIDFDEINENAKRLA